MCHFNFGDEGANIVWTQFSFVKSFDMAEREVKSKGKKLASSCCNCIISKKKFVSLTFFFRRVENIEVLEGI